MHQGVLQNAVSGIKKHRLTRCDLSNAVVRNSNVGAILSAVKKLPGVTALNLDDNTISDKGVEIIAKELPENVSTLILNRNNITLNGLQALINIPQIRSLSLECNNIELREHKAASSIVGRLLDPECKLTELKLGRNSISTEYKEAIDKAIGLKDKGSPVTNFLIQQFHIESLVDEKKLGIRSAFSFSPTVDRNLLVVYRKLNLMIGLAKWTFGGGVRRLSKEVPSQESVIIESRATRMARFFLAYNARQGLHLPQEIVGSIEQLLEILKFLERVIPNEQSPGEKSDDPYRVEEDLKKSSFEKPPVAPVEGAALFGERGKRHGEPMQKSENGSSPDEDVASKGEDRPAVKAM